MDRLSYGLGSILAANLKQQGFDTVNGQDFLMGFQAILDGQQPEVSAEEANRLVGEALASGASAQNMDSGNEFLATNGARQEVVSLPSGLQYEIMNTGEGAKPSATDKVTTHYHGTLIDGTVFDSSVQRGEPATFPVNGVIQGWVEALQLMNVGSKWKLFVPPHLAYGDRGAGQMIGPNSTLIFEVELLSIA
ncbi:MAG: FKBP-type peptidyl-prolyl cis-trans isomerase [Saprospiraceae bacterium]|nr:FKBP-type peptidyl-prolyl cis-trans isomerase [Saprospiraceae bacterium]